MHVPRLGPVDRPIDADSNGNEFGSETCGSIRLDRGTYCIEQKAVMPSSTTANSSTTVDYGVRVPVWDDIEFEDRMSYRYGAGGVVNYAFVPRTPRAGGFHLTICRLPVAWFRFIASIIRSITHA